MAIKPKKQMPANKGETGGGAPRGAAGRGYGAESKVSKLNRKAGEVIRKGQSETIAKNSVKVVKGSPSEAKRLNEFANKRTQDIASGARVKREAGNVQQPKPAKVVKVNSGRSNNNGFDYAGGAAANNAKALKAANKGKKK